MPYTDWTSLAHTTQDYIPVANVVGAAAVANYPVNVKNYGAVGDGVTDDTAAILAAYTASRSLIFPEGTYLFSSFPNLANYGTSIVGFGQVILSFTGTGQGIKIDAGAVTGTVNNIHLENLIINGTASGTDGLFLRGVCRSRFINIRVRNFATSAMRMNFTVCNTFEDFVCSSNDHTPTVTTSSGIILDARAVSEQSSTNTFINPVIEGVSGIGINFISGIKNVIVGGTSEGNGTGTSIGSLSYENEIIGTGFEANTVDISCAGYRTRFINIFSDTDVNITAGDSNVISGGQVKNITISAGVKNTLLDSVAYNGSITDGSTAGQTNKISVFNITGAAKATDVIGKLSVTDTTSTSINTAGGVNASGAGAFGGVVTAGAGTHIFGTNAGTGSQRIQINGAAGSTRSLQICTAGLARWIFVGNSNAESGGNAGTDFAMSAYSDAEALIDSPITIGRVGGGAMTLGGSSQRPITCTYSFKSTHATAGIGYGTGAGGTVTQATGRTTGVTLNKICGEITLVSAAGSTTPASFTVTNSAVAATDTIVLNQKSGTDKYVLLVTAVAAGSFEITAYTTGGTTTEQPVINFSVIKAVSA